MKDRCWWWPLVLLAAGPARADGPRRADVVVYGGTAGGVVAAVSASREGKLALIVEPGRHVGGMVSGGLGATDAGNRAAIGGVSREFFRRARDRYVAEYGPASPQVKDCSDGFHFEPKVAEAVFRAMLAEAKVEVVFGRSLDRVKRDGAKILRIVTDRGEAFEAPVFVDASYEGDLMAKAGVRYATGREGRDQYGESIAGVQARSPAHQWPVVVPATGPDGLPLPGVEPGPADPSGSGDDRTQAYNYRLCMTDRPENRLPFPKPAGYDPARYELLARYLALKPDLKVGQLMNPVRMPNGKTDTNNNGPYSTDHIGANRDYPEAGPARRAAIRDDHVAYVQGFLYFLANDPRVPPRLHAEMANWGLAKDEFVEEGGWPHQLYVREARRMVGSYVMTQADIMDDRTKVNSVGLGSYNTDSHHARRFVQDDGSALNEGDFQVKVSPYAIPYRSLVPRPSECSNLLVPVCMSASHVAYGTVRMEPVYMILGQACGVAAALAIDEGVPVQAVPFERLGSKLAAQGAILSPLNLPGAPRTGLDPGALGGVVVDDPEAKKQGDWTASAAVGPYVGAGYLHDGGRGDGSCRARFTPHLPAAGRYEVRLYSTPNPNRATNAPVTVRSAEGERTFRVDQRKPSKDAPAFVLGVFAFEAGDSGWVEVGDLGADGHVIVNAVRFAPAP